MSSFFDLRTLLLILSTVAAAVVFAMSLVALNTMLMAMRERRTETAVMRAGLGIFAVVGRCADPGGIDGNRTARWDRGMRGGLFDGEAASGFDSAARSSGPVRNSSASHSRASARAGRVDWSRSRCGSCGGIRAPRNCRDLRAVG